MKMKIKNIWLQLILSIKRGFGTSSLPTDIDKFNRKLYVRVFRVMGMYSTTSILLNTSKEYHVEYPLYIYLVLLLLNFLYFVYSCWLNYHRVKHMKKVLKSGELDIKKSPIRKIPSAFSKSYYCFKGVCEGVGMVGVGLGLCAGIDGTLSYTGHDPVLVPAIAKTIEPILPVNDRVLVNTVRKRDECNAERLKLWNEYYDATLKGDIEYSKTLERLIQAKIAEKEQLGVRIASIQKRLSKKYNGEE